MPKRRKRKSRPYLLVNGKKFYGPQTGKGFFSFIRKIAKGIGRVAKKIVRPAINITRSVAPFIPVIGKPLGKAVSIVDKVGKQIGFGKNGRMKKARSASVVCPCGHKMKMQKGEGIGSFFKRVLAFGRKYGRKGANFVKKAASVFNKLVKTVDSIKHANRPQRPSMPTIPIRIQPIPPRGGVRVLPVRPPRPPRPPRHRQSGGRGRVLVTDSHGRITTMPVPIVRNGHIQF